MKIKKAFNKGKLYKSKWDGTYLVASKTKITRYTTHTPEESKNLWEKEIIRFMTPVISSYLKKYWEEVK